jgi:MFS family permease
MGAVFMPLTVVSVSTIPKEDMGQATTIGSVVAQFSMAMSPALVATLLIANTPSSSEIAPPAAYRTVYLVLAVMALAASLFTLTLPDARAPRTPPGPRFSRRHRDTPLAHRSRS